MENQKIHIEIKDMSSTKRGDVRKRRKRGRNLRRRRRAKEK